MATKKKKTQTGTNLLERVWSQNIQDSQDNESTHAPLSAAARSVGFKDSNPFPGPGKTTGGKTVTKKGPSRVSPKLGAPSPSGAPPVVKHKARRPRGGK